jgi:RNA polymerase sigma factor (sigma-70 family)
MIVNLSIVAFLIGFFIGSLFSVFYFISYRQHLSVIRSRLADAEKSIDDDILTLRADLSKTMVGNELMKLVPSLGTSADLREQELPKNEEDLPKAIYTFLKEVLENEISKGPDESILMENLILAINTDLTEDQRRVITLRAQGFSLRQTADALGKEVYNVKVIQNRAVAKLRRKLGLTLKETS